ncbi:MAG TPA: SsrA-binding protein SmpB [Candidatus Saccharimonadales bacterium]|nr:SsrA-binding protein SmpB [Candidatus Saccharimonadales bacterium]
MDQSKLIAENRKARHDYHILGRVEAGIALAGTEVKSLRAGKASLADSYAAIEGREAFLHNLHISPYDPASRFNHDPRRKRKLLLHRSEIRRLRAQTDEKGCTLVPLKLYFNADGRAKVELAVARGKRAHDRRDTLSEREARREIERAMKERR